MAHASVAYFSRMVMRMPYKDLEKRKECHKRFRDRNRDRIRQESREKARLMDPEIKRRNANKHYFLNRNSILERLRIIRKTEAYKRKARTRLKSWRHFKILGNCEICGDKATERHHTDYNKPFVIHFLCSKCHGIIHRSQKSEF